MRFRWICWKFLEVFRIRNKIEGIKEKDFFIRDLKGGRGHSFKSLFKKEGSIGCC